MDPSVGRVIDIPQWIQWMLNVLHNCHSHMFLPQLSKAHMPNLVLRFAIDGWGTAQDTVNRTQLVLTWRTSPMETLLSRAAEFRWHKTCQSGTEELWHEERCGRERGVRMPSLWTKFASLWMRAVWSPFSQLV